MHETDRTDVDLSRIDRIFSRAESDLTWRMLALSGWQTALIMLLIVAFR